MTRWRGSLLDLSLWAVFGAGAGARLAYVLQFPCRYLHHPLHALTLRDGGLALIGVIPGSLLCVYGYLKIEAGDRR